MHTSGINVYNIFPPPQKKKKKQSKTKNLAKFLRGFFCSRTTPVPPETIFHRMKIKPNYSPPGPWSLGQLPTRATTNQIKPLIRTNTYTVGNCPDAVQVFFFMVTCHSLQEGVWSLPPSSWPHLDRWPTLRAAPRRWPSAPWSAGSAPRLACGAGCPAVTPCTGQTQSGQCKQEKSNAMLFNVQM